MPDISMCLNDKCDRKETCWRYIAPPCKYQCYGVFDHNACKYYWPIDAAVIAALMEEGVE